MRKYLPIVAAVALIIAVVFVARYNKDYDASGKGYDAKCVDASEPSTGVGSFVCTIQPGQEAQNGKSGSAWWHILLTWPEGITTWAVILTLGAITWQAFLMRKHAEHFEKLAGATHKQANHMVASERAWIIVSTSFPHGIEDGSQSKILRVKWAMKNVGKTPARLLEFDAVASRADLGVTFPDPPRYSGSPRNLNRLLLVPNDSFGWTWMIEGDALTPEEIQEVEIGAKLMIISYGYIKYLDDFGNAHTTRFCQRYAVNAKTREARFESHTEAPTSYTDCD
jgi:hypothetical protein